MSRPLVRIVAFLAAAAAAIAIGIIAGEHFLRPGTGGNAGGPAAIGGPFTLTDQNGTARTDAEFRGKLMMVYFGYTFCPDACPTALNAMSVALNELGPAAAKQVVPIFITVDPERDTVKQMKLYASNFYPTLVALTGSPEAISHAAKEYRVYYAKQKAADTTEGYLMDHTSVIYLMGRDGRYLAHFTHTSAPDAIAAELRKHINGGAQS